MQLSGGPQLIVSVLLTFIISLLHSAAANILVEIICKLYDNDDIKYQMSPMCCQ